MVYPWQIAVLFATGLVAGFVDSIAGGGGLITLPVLLSLGFDTRHALGTNKVQAVFGSGSAAVHYQRAKAVVLKDCVRGFLFSLAGAALGTVSVQHVNRELLQRGIPLVLLAVAIYTLLRPRLGEKDLHPRMSRRGFDVLFGLGLGFYVAPMRVFRGTEADILPDGTIDYGAKTLKQFDFVVASVHSRFSPSRAPSTTSRALPWGPAS